MNDTLKPIHHRRIPALPSRPRVHPTAHKIFRSYPVGRQNFSRACQGKVLTLTITMDDTIPGGVQASLVTTLNANGSGDWTTVPFERTDERTLRCSITPESPGFHTFRAEFSADGGVTWNRDNVPDAWVLVDPAHVEAMRMYALIPTVSGTFADWTADLKRIRDMGFNAIHLMPVTALDISESPYAAKDLFSVDNSYAVQGTHHSGLSQLEEFIAEAKALNLRLCFDLVLNHVGVHSTMANKAPDWIVPDQNQPDGLQRAGYWCDKGWMPWNDIVLINYEHPSEMIRSEIWTYMTSYALFWAKFANDTGGFVRFDNLHSSNADFVQAITTALHTEYPQVGFVAEYFTDERTLLRTTPQWRLNLILATPWNHKFVPQLREYLTYIHRLAEQVRYFMPITSHDSGAPAEEFGSPESTIPRYTAAALLGTGATGITQGVEFGEDKHIEFIGRKPKITYPDEAKYAPFISKVNSILTDYPAFQLGANCEFLDNGHHAIIAAFRRDPEMKSIGFLVVCNFDISETQSISMDLSSVVGTEGVFSSLELLTEETQNHSNPHIELQLAPCSAQVLRLSKKKDSYASPP